MDGKSTREDAEKAAAAWLSKRADPQWCDADRIKLDRWLAESPGHRVSFIRLESIWTDTDRLRSIACGFPKGQVPQRGAIEQSPFFTAKQVDANKAGSSGNLEKNASVRKRLAIAAFVLVVIAIGITVYSANVARGGKIYSTSLGGLSTVPVQDGSVITLNTDSEVEVLISAEERSIKLTKGEAFFDVAKDPNRPFIVYANDRRVVAVGTKFSVRLNSETIHVAVVEGKVRLEERPRALNLSRVSRAAAKRNSGTANDGLVAGTVADVAGSGVRIQQQPISEIEQRLSWRTGYIVLEGTPLAEAVAEFNRYNPRQVVIGDASLATLKIEGNFRSNNLDGFVRLVERGFAVKAREEGGAIVLNRK